MSTSPAIVARCWPRTYGFPASPAVGAGLVVIGGLDGRVHAFAQ